VEALNLISKTKQNCKNANLCIVDNKNTDLVDINSLIIETKNKFKIVKSKSFFENYPYLTVENFKSLPRLVERILDNIEETDRIYMYQNDYGRRTSYLTDYYTEEIFEKEDEKIDKQFLKDYLDAHSDKKINNNLFEETSEDNTKDLLDNPEMFKLLSLMTNISSKEELLIAINDKLLGNIPMLIGNPGLITQNNIEKSFVFYQTLLKLECPLYFSKEMKNIRYALTSNPMFRDCKEIGDAYTILETDIFDIRYYKGDRDCWDEIHIHIKNGSTILVSNIGKCNYSNDVNVEDVKNGIWHDFLNEFVCKIISFNKLIEKYDELRHEKHMELIETYKEQFETKKLDEIERLFFDSVTTDSLGGVSGANSKSSRTKCINKNDEKQSINNLNITEPIKKALSCFGIPEIELKKLTQKRVKDLYRDFIKRNHPDINNNSNISVEKTIELNGSKEILVNYLKQQIIKNKKQGGI